PGDGRISDCLRFLRPDRPRADGLDVRFQAPDVCRDVALARRGGAVRLGKVVAEADLDSPAGVDVDRGESGDERNRIAPRWIDHETQPDVSRDRSSQSQGREGLEFGRSGGMIEDPYGVDPGAVAHDGHLAQTFATAPVIEDDAEANQPTGGWPRR